MINYLDMVRIQLIPDERLKLEEPICSPEDAVKRFGEELRLYNREVLASVNLSASGDVLSIHLLSMGSVNDSVVSVPEIMRTCLLANASRLILMHNHPSGNAQPSTNDKDITRMVRQACRLMDIELLDHVIVGGMKQGMYSFKESGLLEELERENWREPARKTYSLS